MTLPITARRVRVDFPPLSKQPQDWADGDPAITEIFHALSITFPIGETFFIESVRRYAKRLRASHPALFEQIQLFYKQEAMHTAAHEALNSRIKEEYGHDMDALEAIVEQKLGRAQRYLDGKTQLAITCCLEHFTAVLGHTLLGSSSGRAMQLKCSQPYRRLWVWHAVEEIEHKGVAFDVYKAVGGSYLTRCIVMLFVTVLFQFRIFQFWCKLMAQRGLLYRRASWQSLLKFLYWSPGVWWQVVPQWLSWFRPSFHPWDRDDSSLVLEYSSELAKTVVTEPLSASEPGDVGGVYVFGYDSDSGSVTAEPAVAKAKL